MQCIDDSLAEEKETETLTLDAVFDLAKEGNEWKLSDAPEEIFDAMTGNVLKAFSEIAEDFSMFEGGEE